MRTALETLVQGGLCALKKFFLDSRQNGLPRSDRKEEVHIWNPPENYMLMSNYYLKRGEKAFGPLSWERLESLAASGKIGDTASIATSAGGPWKSFGEFQSELVGDKEKPVESSGGFLGGFPLDTIPPVSATPSSSSYWSAPPAAPASRVVRQSRTTDSTELEEEEASFFVRIFLPWAGENSQARYGNLDRYIKIFKFINRFFFILGLISVILAAVGSSLYVFVSGEYTVFEVVGSTILGFIWTIVLLLVLHLFYIASMALCDFLRLAMDVEANTRRRG
jgi:hypothetical protein